MKLHTILWVFLTDMTGPVRDEASVCRLRGVCLSVGDEDKHN